MLGDHADIHCELIWDFLYRCLNVTSLIFPADLTSVDLSCLVVFLDMYEFPDLRMEGVTPDLILLSIIVVNEGADIVGDYLFKIGLPVLQLILGKLFHAMRKVPHSDVPVVHGVPPNKGG